MVCEDGMLTRTAMQAGIGIALTRPLLIEQELKSGKLVQLSEHGVHSDEDYYLCVRADRDPPPALKLLAAWLRLSAGKPATVPAGRAKRKGSA
jgi:DNA-binding transcriptional LysR family regulator